MDLFTRRTTPTEETTTTTTTTTMRDNSNSPRVHDAPTATTRTIELTGSCNRRGRKKEKLKGPFFFLSFLLSSALALDLQFVQSLSL